MADDGSPAPRYVIETSDQAVRAGRFWWFSEWQNPLSQAIRRADQAERRALLGGVISLRAAQDLHQKGLV